MREYKDYERILSLWESGETKKGIARSTGISRSTVRDCIALYGSLAGLEQNRERASRSTPDALLNSIQNSQNRDIQTAYAYLLGIYLGDGYIVRHGQIYYLRIILDNAYPGIIEHCQSSLQILLPLNRVNVLPRKNDNCVEVICMHKFWPEIFPQHGSGPKHERAIRLEAWQQEITDRYPVEFLRGLYHSDGSRFRNVVNGKDYPRYQFTNYSADIRRLFCDTCDKLGIHWRLKQLKAAGHTTDIFISRRKDVAYLDNVDRPQVLTPSGKPQIRACAIMRS